MGTDRQAFLRKRHATMSAHPCHHGMDYTAPTHRGSLSKPARRGDAHHQRRRRELRRADPQPARPPPKAGRLRGAFLREGARPASPAQGRPAPGDRERDHRRAAYRRRRHRVTGRRWCRDHAAAEVRHPGSRGPRKRYLAALRQTRGRRPPHRQGLRHGGSRLAADVLAASRHAHHRGQALAAVRPLCRLLHQVPHARLSARSKKDRTRTGALVFGTEIVSCADSSIVVLPGTSTGASTAA